jgi:hypothetical protein
MTHVDKGELFAHHNIHSDTHAEEVDGLAAVNRVAWLSTVSLFAKA